MAKIPYDFRPIRALHPEAYEAISNGGPIAPTEELNLRDERHRLYSIADLSDLPPVKFLIQDWLPETEHSLLWGDSGSLKSFIAIEWGCQLAVDGRLIVYVAAEGAAGIRGRAHAWMVVREVTKPPDLLVMAHNTDLWTPQGAETWRSDLKQEIKRHGYGDRKPDLIVLDTLNRVTVGAEENSARDMGHYIENVEETKREFETAVLTVHHANAGSQKERGSTALRGAAAATFRVTRKPPSLTAKLECRKAKDVAEPGDVAISFQVIEVPWIDPDSAAEGRPTPTSLAMEKPFIELANLPRREGRTEESENAGVKRRGPDAKDRKLLNAGVKRRGRIVKTETTMKALSCSEKTARRRQEFLSDKGLLEPRGEGRGAHYIVTAEGEKAAKPA